MKEEVNKIEYTEWAVANIFKDGTIELHNDLQKPEYIKLKQQIISHELEHDYNKGFLYNFKVDFFNVASSKELIKFMIKRPKTWIQLLPFYYTKERGIVYDKVNLLFYFLLSILIFSIIKLTGGI